MIFKSILIVYKFFSIVFFMVQKNNGIVTKIKRRCYVSVKKGRRTKDEGRRTKDEGQRTKDKGRRTKDKGRKN